MSRVRAIDLGCGAGNETRELLRRGWTVLAIDGEREAIEHLERVVPSEQRDRLQAEVMPFDRLVLPQADLIWAGLSLSFMDPSVFDGAWATIVDALRPGGLLACDIFGPRHAWADQAITILDEAAVRAKLAGLDVEHFEAQEEDLQTAFDGIPHWHGYWMIARKPVG